MINFKDSVKLVTLNKSILVGNLKEAIIKTSRLLAMPISLQ